MESLSSTAGEVSQELGGTPTTPPPEAPAPSRYKVKVEGQEMEVGLDELLRGYTHGKAASRRMQEAAEARKRAEAQLARAESTAKKLLRLRDDPEAFEELSSELGLDFDSLAEKRVLDKIKLELMSEPEKRAHELEKQIAKMQKELSNRDSRQREIEQARVAAQVEDEILSVWNASDDKDPRVLARAIEFQLAALDSDRDLPFEAAYKLARKESQSWEQSRFDSILRARLERGEIPEELLKLVRQKDVASLRKAPPPRPAQTSPRKTTTTRTVDDAFKEIEARYGGK